MPIVVDYRWAGDHGIGRFCREVSKRLEAATLWSDGSHPASLRGLVALTAMARRLQPGDLLFSPGFMPPLRSSAPVVLTIHDLIHVDPAAGVSWAKQQFYKNVVRPSAQRASAILTVSHFSKQKIVDWCGCAPDQVHVVGNGVSDSFQVAGPRHVGKKPYLIYVGNRKAHKNLDRMVAAFALFLRSHPTVELYLSGSPDAETSHMLIRHGVACSVRYLHQQNDFDLAAFYRGASALLMVSLHEGFGLPALEGMACGTPVIASSGTAVAEVTAEAGYLADPLDVNDICKQMELVMSNHALRECRLARGLIRAAEYSWASVAEKTRRVLMSA